MKIIEDNITNATGDYIVNSSNIKLILDSGVSEAIKKHCGIEIQKEMSRHAPIPQGSVVKTSAGKSTSFGAVLHTAITDMKSSTTLSVVQRALDNIDSYCSEDIKLIIPLLGTGIGGLSKDDVLKRYEHFFANKPYDVEVWII